MICTASNAHGDWITGLAKLPSDTNMDCIISSSRDGTVKIWDKDLKESCEADVTLGTNSPVESICVNKKLLFTAGGISDNNGVVRYVSHLSSSLFLYT
jgi:WD40 repeat protein